MNRRTKRVKALAQVAIAVALINSAATTDAIVDLTPTPGEYEAQGITYRQLMFKDDERKVSYDLPHGWSYRFDAGRIVLSPADTAFAEASIDAVPSPKPQLFDQPTVDRMTQQVLSTLPPNSDGITITKSEQNPVLLNSNTSYEIVVSYKTMGSVFQRSVLFVNVPGTQLIFKLSARKADFDRLYGIFRASVLTWQWLETSEATGRQSTTSALATR